MRRIIFTLATVPFMLLGGLTAQAGDVVQVVQEWTLKVAEPDVNSSGPQVAIVVSPTGDVRGIHAVFEINHRNLPSFSAGGLQFQLWNGDGDINHHNAGDSSLFATAEEVVTFKVRLYLSGGNLVIEVIDGNSSTWGSFGGTGTLKFVVQTDLTNLNGYNTDVTVANSGVAFAGHRVCCLKLNRVRKYDSNGSHVDEAERVLHETVDHDN